MPRILTWDLEIRHPVHEVGGWHAVRAGEAGVSILVIKDTETGRPHFYDDHNLDAALAHLNAGDLLVGFNTIDFDTAVVQSITGECITTPQYDILAAIWAASRGRPKGYKLDQVASRTLGVGKSGDGTFATTLVSRGRWADLVDYCANDVFLTAKLYNHIVEKGWVQSPDNGELWLPEPPSKEHA